ncbi:MAG TPA: HAMP domain-containing sensor histidine kinase [Rhodocyclaceae bacterium]
MTSRKPITFVNPYPRSFLRLVVLSNVLVALPLLFAVGYASLTADSMSRRGQAMMHDASRAAMLAHELPEDIEHMEVLLRQYEVLRDPTILDDYETAHADWVRHADECVAIPLLASLGERIGEVRAREDAAHRALGPHAEGLSEVKVALASLKRLVVPLFDEANVLVDRERDSLRRQAETLWQRLLVALLAALLLTGVLLAYARRLVERLWSRFERAVQALGEGRLDRPIRLKGPEDMQRAGRRLEWLRRRMVSLEEERTRVLRHVSHELKTPLAALREGASLLNEGVAGPLTPQQTKIAAIMQLNSIRLQELIDGLLRMQQASHARENMEIGAVRFDQVVEQTLATYQLAARDRLVRISGSLAPVTVEGGSEALATLAGNLISNAIKFSPDGGTVNVSLRSDGADAVLDVTDEGPGIAPHEKSHIFEPFFRGAAGKQATGVGLGLAIAHEFALAHRGRLEIVDCREGAHFRAHLPLAGAPA